MNWCSVSFFLFICLVFAGCDLSQDDEAALLIWTEDFDFNESHYDWQAGFADYPANPEDSSQFELRFAYTEPVDSKLTKRSVMLSGKNVNKDLFMYLKRKISHLQPNTDYTITFNVELASDLNAVLAASGGSVYLKAGASHTEPKSVIEEGSYVMNIDKGNAQSAGEDMILLGDILSVTNTSSYALINRNNTMANSRYVARTNSNGEIWLIIGTDSTCEGISRVFYTRIGVVLSAS